MKATLHFNDEGDLRLALNGRKYFGCLWDIDQKLRAVVKYGSDDDRDTICCAVRDMIADMNMDEIE